VKYGLLQCRLSLVDKKSDEYKVTVTGISVSHIFVEVFPFAFLLHWPGGVMVTVLDLRPSRLRFPVPAVPLSHNGFGHCFSHTRAFCYQAVYRYRSCWEGNRRSGVALAMRHRLHWFVHLRAHGLREISTPPTLFVVCGRLPLLLQKQFISALLPTAITDKVMQSVVSVRPFVSTSF